MNDITFGSYVGNGIKEIMKNMEDLYPPFGTWIPVTDELPKEEGWYLISVDPYYMPPNCDLVDHLYWNGKDWIYESFEGTKLCNEILDPKECPVLAWMPKPKPYLTWNEKTNQRVKQI